MMLSGIHQYNSQRNESTHAYVNEFETFTAKYFLQTNMRSRTNDRQWALLLFQNAKFSANTQDAVVFQLTKTHPFINQKSERYNRRPK